MRIVSSRTAELLSATVIADKACAEAAHCRWKNTISVASILMKDRGSCEARESSQIGRVEAQRDSLGHQRGAAKIKAPGPKSER